MPEYWSALEVFLSSKRIVIDRPRGTAHPHYPSFIYPLDYGYVADTMAPDGHEIDVWRGTTGTGRIDAILCTVDLHNMDAELKIVVSCTADEMGLICRTQNTGGMSAILIRRG